jgi:hypothetical protein
VLEEDRESHQGIGAVNITRLCKQYTSVLPTTSPRTIPHAIPSASTPAPRPSLRRHSSCMR